MFKILTKRRCSLNTEIAQGGQQVDRINDGSGVLWFESATVTSQALKFDVITYTLYESLNYTIFDKITPL